MKKGIYSAILVLAIFLSGCGGTFQSAGQYEAGKQAL